MELAEARRHWKTLSGAWEQANQEAREAEQRVTLGFIACARNSGPIPTDADLKNAEQLRAVADRHKGECDNFLRSYFGE